MSTPGLTSSGDNDLMMMDYLRQNQLEVMGRSVTVAQLRFLCQSVTMMIIVPSLMNSLALLKKISTYI